eukprot:c23598_g1_i1.p1 GENE.c23598_g1_i1~~c23598_g1_i1.p1  ORF type:complete len:440 (-),score=102.26 c23598_g1_i1:482-1702(-)
MENKDEENRALRQKLLVLEQEQLAHEIIRRRLHNAIQDLRGNIRVFCRVRPVLEVEAGPQDVLLLDCTSTYTREGLQEVVVRNPASNNRSSVPISFAFDRVFGPDTSQTQVFEEIDPLIQSALDGYRVCIFAYGQTGSGKTFTMEGPDNNSSDHSLLGILPRSLDKIMHNAELMQRSGWSLDLECSFVEIYNDEIRDLLDDTTTSPRRGLGLHSRVGEDGVGVEVSGARIVRVTSQEQCRALLRYASAARVVAATNVNKHSSRSHTVFQLRIGGNRRGTSEELHGQLNLIDLAGSERLSKTGDVEARKAEARHINKSLSALADVIAALANHESHVPYRNSKLTHLLKDSLGGDSKMLMFCNVSPELPSATETICSLRFAHKVNRTHLGTAKKHTKVDLASFFQEEP